MTVDNGPKPPDSNPELELNLNPIFRARTARGMNRGDFALSIGVSRITLEECERGIQQRPRKVLLAVAQLTETPLDLLEEQYVVWRSHRARRLRELAARAADAAPGKAAAGA